jgi:ethanolamine ammonia-lyase large subunit
MSNGPMTYYYLVGLVYLVGRFYLVAVGQDNDDGNQVEASHETVELLLMLKEKMEIVSFVGTNGIGGSNSVLLVVQSTGFDNNKKMFRKNKIAMLLLKNSKDGK